MKQVNPRIYRTILTLVLGLFLSVGAYAQNITVKGTVTDATGEPVIGANVLEKGTTNGVITDIDGNFQLQTSRGAILQVSFVGFLTAEVKAAPNVNVILQEDSQLLSDVVVIGYAAVPRRDLTGSVTSVSSKELSKVPVSDVTQALTGRMAGVMVQQSEGTPGASISVRVRGGISITQSNEPLYIIDGFPSEDGMSTLDPAEIETIDVLKDASATAIYGARGANGVVVITTKNGS